MKPFRSILAVAFALLALTGLTACRRSPGPGVKLVVADHVVPPLIVTAPPGTVLPAKAMPKADKHAAFGVTCNPCHGTDAPVSAPESNKACFTCHKADVLIKASARFDNVHEKSQNPHDSHMHGASCFVCHRNHGTSELYCDRCHKPTFGWKVP